MEWANDNYYCLLIMVEPSAGVKVSIQGFITEKTNIKDHYKITGCIGRGKRMNLRQVLMVKSESVSTRKLSS